jgi:quercetin dioxygenase-like cupin family protein
MSHVVLDADEVEAGHGVFRALSAPLGVGTFKVNRLELKAGGQSPEHDHASNGEEEVYAVIDGSGTLVVDGEEVALRPGHFVFCSPDARRQMRAGDDGLIYIGIGSASREAPAGA